MPDRPSVTTLVTQIATLLRDAGIDQPRAEARLIVARATGLDHARQLMDGHHPIDGETALAMARRRAGREPMAYLLGQREFWSLDFAVGPGVLVPRPETETLIETVLDSLPDRNAQLHILDLGTGSGCLLLTLLTLYPNARGIGIDRSPEALAWAARNRTGLGLEQRALLVQGDWLEAVKGPVDLVIANPPYVALSDARDAETGHEPEAALFAGTDGLAAYRDIAAPALAALRPNGHVVLEIGATQAAAVTAILETAGFATITWRTDLAGRPRVVAARRES